MVLSAKLRNRKLATPCTNYGTVGENMESGVLFVAYYRDDKKVEIAISILRKAIESFDKETIGQESACLGKQLLWETLATYLGDVEKYEDAIFYAKKGMKKILESGSAKGISGELYEIAWNERERKAKPEIYQKKYFQALKFTILFQEREFIIFLKQREQEYKK